MRRFSRRRRGPGRSIAPGGGAGVADAAARVAAFSIRRTRLVVGIVALLAVASALLALRLDPSAAIDTLVDRDSESFRATDAYHRQFGDEPIAVLVRGAEGTSRCRPACRLTDILLTSDLARVGALEGCLSGNLPRRARPLASACGELARRKPVQVVYGPGTFINESVRQIAGRFDREADRAARAARSVARAQGLGKADQDRLASRARELVAAQFALESGLSSIPSVNNPEFVLRLVFDPELGATVPKARFSYLFPNSRSALIQARLRPGLSESERERAVRLVREAVESPRFQLRRGEYVVSGAPVVVQAVTASVSDALAVLIVAAVLIMGLTLALVFRSNRRLLPLGLALAAAAVTFGVASLAGAELTLASIAVLPVVVGLAVDYAIQFQARFDESRDRAGPSATEVGASPPEPEDRPPASLERAAVEAARSGAPVIGTAGLATAAGLLVLLLSPVPMVRDFAALVVVGIVIALAFALTAGLAILGSGHVPGEDVARRGIRRAARLRPRARLAPLGRSLASALFSAGRAVGSAGLWLVRPLARLGRLRVFAGGREALMRVVRSAPSRVAAAARAAPSATGKAWRRAFEGSIRRPRRVIAVALVAALVGWLADTRTDVVSDLERLVPGDLQAVQDFRTLERETGAAGDVNVVVRSERLTTPAVIRWMTEYQQRVLARNGYSEERSCRRADLCPGISLTNLFGSETPTSARQVTALLDALPPYFSQAVVSPDRRTASMTFGIKEMPLDEQKEIIDDLRGQLDPPAGVQAELAGLPVVLADGNAKLESSRRLLTLGGLAAVLVVLLAVYRRVRRAVVPLVPVALATGWSALVLYLLGIPLNPMSAALGALVIAIATEFSVILSARYGQERARGSTPAIALERTYARTGPAVLASAVTAIAGFAALVASDVQMLRDFGFVTVVDLAVALAGVTLVLPAALVLSEEGVRLGIPRTRSEALAAGRTARSRVADALRRGRRGARSALGRVTPLVRRAPRARSVGRRLRSLRRRDEGQRP